jgi:hypothetical protein
MMNILPRNPADREAKSPCDKNIRYPECVPGHDSPNGNTFLTIVVYMIGYIINRKPPSWMTQVTWSTLVDCLRADLRARGGFWPGDNLLVWSGHLDHPLGRSSYYITASNTISKAQYMYLQCESTQLMFINVSLWPFSPLQSRQLERLTYFFQWIW